MKTPLLYHCGACLNRTILSLCLVCIFYSLSAQLVEGQKAIDLGAGKSDIGLMIRGGYISYLPYGFSIRGGAFYETGNPYQFKYRNLGFDAALRYNLFDIYNIVYINPSAGPVLNYDQISPVKKEFSSSLNYGLKVGIEAEALLNNNFSFVAFCDQLLLIHKNFGNQRYDYGIGIRLYIGN